MGCCFGKRVPQQSADARFTNVFMSNQQTKGATEKLSKWLKDIKGPPDRCVIKASLPPFNLRKDAEGKDVPLPAGAVGLNAPVFGTKIPEAIMECFDCKTLRSLAVEMRIDIPEYALDTFIQGKIGNARDLTKMARERSDFGSNQEAVERLDRFIDAFEKLDKAAFTNFQQWREFIKPFASEGWETKLHFDDLLGNFGFLPETAKELAKMTVTIKDEKTGQTEEVELEHHAFRWISKALGGFKPVGCLTDFANLVCAMMGKTEKTDELSEEQINAMIRSFNEKKKASNFQEMWIPHCFVHDFESDDTLCWLMLEHIHRLMGKGAPSSLQVLVQLPTDSEFDSHANWCAEGAYFKGRCLVFRDSESRNAKAVRTNFQRISKINIAIE